MANVERTIENLEKRGFSVSRFADKASAADYLLEQVGDRPVGIGGSMTVKEMELYPRLRERGDTYWHWEKDEENARVKANAAPIYIMSANGVAETGEIINIDGTGNRVQQMCCGPEKLYIVIGVNKIAPDEAMAMWRARNIGAVKNARRLGTDTACVKGEARCYDCSSPKRICRVFVTQQYKPGGIGDVEVVIIDEALGY